MSADLNTQHAGQPEEPGTPGVQRYRKARAALAAAAELQPTLQGTHALVNFDLMEALKAFMPTYRVIETYAEGDRIRQVTAAEGLESRAVDRGCRPCSSPHVPHRGRGEEPVSRARRLYRKALKLQRKADRHANVAERAYRRSHRHAEKSAHFEDLADRYDDLSREARK